MRHTRLIVPAALALALIVGPAALAAGGFGLNEAARSAGLSTEGSVTSILGNIIRIALGFVGTIFLLLTLYAGFKWMTARGDAKKIGEAQQMITGAVAGIVVISAAYVIASFVINASSSISGGPGGSVETPGAGDDQIELTCSSDADCASGQACGAADAAGDRYCQ